MANHPFIDIEIRLGIRLPRSVNSFFSLKPKCRFYEQPEGYKIESFSELYPAVPLRVLPLLPVGNGDFVGLYYPRTGSSPFVVEFGHEESAISRVTSNVDDFFTDPDRYSCHHPLSKVKPIKIDSSAWSDLLVKPAKQKLPELELLKPFSLHYRELEQKLDLHFQPLMSRFSTGKGVPGLIHQHLTKPLDLLDRNRWISLSHALVKKGAWNEAIQCMDNCLAIHFIHPYYGQPERKGAHDWRYILELFELMHPWVKIHGDKFDQETVGHQLTLAREFEANEKKNTVQKRRRGNP